MRGVRGRSREFGRGEGRHLQTKANSNITMQLKFSRLARCNEKPKTPQLTRCLALVPWRAAEGVRVFDYHSDAIAAWNQNTTQTVGGYVNNMAAPKTVTLILLLFYSYQPSNHVVLSPKHSNPIHKCLDTVVTQSNRVCSIECPLVSCSEHLFCTNLLGKWPRFLSFMAVKLAALRSVYAISSTPFKLFMDFKQCHPPGML